MKISPGLIVLGLLVYAFIKGKEETIAPENVGGGGGGGGGGNIYGNTTPGGTPTATSVAINIKKPTLVPESTRPVISAVPTSTMPRVNKI